MLYLMLIFNVCRRRQKRMSGFQFKQFYIEHASSAMKVGTDSIMLGSWVDVVGAQNILDIGAGSGLLAIMLAQKTSEDCQILGIDIDAAATQQAIKNAEQSPWSKQLFFESISIQNLCSDNAFDLIISNPPYFPINHASNLINTQNMRINARQTAELTHLVLLENIDKHLSEDGRFFCVLPDESLLRFIEFSESLGLYCTQHLRVQAQPKGKVIRHLLSFRRVKTSTQFSDITIYGEKEKYSTEYRELCKEYYQNF